MGRCSIYMVLYRQHSRIDLSLLQHQSTEEKLWRLLKRGSGDCRTFLCSVAVDTAGHSHLCIFTVFLECIVIYMA